MGETMDKLTNAAAGVADSALKMASTIVNKGKEQADKVALNARLAKMQRQLGALVYSLRKNGQDNEPMIDWYVAEIDRVKMRLAEYDPPEKDSVVVFSAQKQEEAGAEKDAMFCGGDGEDTPGQ